MPADLNGLMIALFAVVPGYVCAEFWARARTRRPAGTDLMKVLQSLALSLVVQVILSPLTIAWFFPLRASISFYPGAHLAVWLAVSVLGVLIVLGVALGRFEDAFLSMRQHATGAWWRKPFEWIWPPSPPSVWDWFFTAQIPSGSYILVELSDGRRVAGTWEEGSYAATSPEPRGPILGREWLVDGDGNFVRQVEGSAGVLIPTDADIWKVRVLVSGHGKTI